MQNLWKVMFFEIPVSVCLLLLMPNPIYVTRNYPEDFSEIELFVS